MESDMPSRSYGSGYQLPQIRPTSSYSSLPAVATRAPALPTVLPSLPAVATRAPALPTVLPSLPRVPLASPQLIPSSSPNLQYGYVNPSSPRASAYRQPRRNRDAIMVDLLLERYPRIYDRLMEEVEGEFDESYEEK